MFEALETPPPDPILALAGLAKADLRPEKLDLGIGIYIDETGNSPVMRAVREAERRVLEKQTSKAYLPARGNDAFLWRLGEKIFGAALWTACGDRIGSLQSTGCVAALRLGGEVLARAGSKRVWLSDPTWPIHAPILSAAGLEPVSYRYHTRGTTGPDWAGMMADLEEVKPGDAVLLHGCCHNPTGADLSLEQWWELAELLAEKRAVALIDIAYAGLGEGWDEDLAGFRHVIDRIDEAVVTVSCSKSFGLYRERIGAVYFVARDGASASAAVANGMVAARTSYSMPPDHGAATVAEILGDEGLEHEWLDELAHMRRRIAGLRGLLGDLAAAAGLDWNFLREQQGMFSLLPLSEDEVAGLRADHAIYMPGNGRICIPGLSETGCAHLVESCLRVSSRVG